MTEVAIALVILASVIPYGTGLLAGVLVRAFVWFRDRPLLWLWVTVQTGYRRGRYGRMD